MASAFTTEDVCEGEDCKAITDVTYYVKEKKKLCEDCASREGCRGKTRQSRANLYCEIHDADIKLYCTTHGVALCYSCTMIDHHHQSCVRQDIEGAIMEIKAKLNGLKEKAMDKLHSCRVHGDQICHCRRETSEHLQAIKHDVDMVIDEVMKIDKDREQEDAAKINQAIDSKNQKLKEEIHKINDEIQKNNKEREKQLKLNLTKAEKRRVPIDNKKHELYTDIQTISEEIERKIGELEKSWKDATKTAENTVQKLKTVLNDDKSIAKDGHRVNTSVTDELEKALDEGGVKHITRTVSNVRFVKGTGREKYNGRIDGYDGKWRLMDTINVKDKIQYPTIVGCINENNVIITDVDSHNTYTLDITTQHIQRVVTGSETSSIISCALVNGDKIVCGKACQGYTGDSSSTSISLYDNQWKLINDVTIPQKTKDDPTWVYVAADQDGMIVAAEAGQSKIYVINPGDGKIINTITFKEDVFLRDVLSSGHIIAQPLSRDDTLLIVDRKGAQMEIPHTDVILDVCVDPLTDAIYVATSHDEYKTCVIDQLVGGGDEKKRTIASLPVSTRSWVRTHLFTCSRVMMTSSGKMMASDGDNIHVLKKLFSL